MEVSLTKDEEDLVADLLVKWEDALEDGEELSADALCTDCPQLTNVVKVRIEALRQTEWLKKNPARPLTDNRKAETKDRSGDVLAERYRLDALLGQGGYGQVYKAYDLKLQRNVAIKIGHARTTTDLLLDEARRVARLRHNSIVQVHDVGEHHGDFFLVFELIEGKSLADLIRDRRLPLRDSVRMIADIAEALHFAHQKGCVHRDIKPENILLDAAGKPLIADFGVATTLSEIEQGKAVSSGTLSYMAPEQIAGETQILDGRCDIHALGVVLFELLTGKPPFEASKSTLLREQILFRQPKKLREADASLPVELELICSRCLSKHPDDRYQSAQELASDLQQWLNLSKTSSHWKWLVGAIVVLVGTGLIGLAIRQRESDVLHFDGRTRIVTNFQRKLPVTIEAWVKPDHYESDKCQFIVGSDIPGKYGYGIAICGSVLSAEHATGMLNSDRAVPPSEWSHVKGVFTATETNLFLNGELIATGPGGEAAGKAKFVIGCAGEQNLTGYYKGKAQSIVIK